MSSLPSPSSLLCVHELFAANWTVTARERQKCTKILNARAEPLFWSLNLLFFDVLVTAVVLFA